MRTPLSTKLIIVGASGFGMEALWLAKRAGYEVLGFLDDTPEKLGERILGHPVLGPVTSWVEYRSTAQFVIAVGSPKARQAIYKKMCSLSDTQPPFATIVDPDAILDSEVVLGEGCIVCAGTIFTVDIVLGRHVIVNLNVTVGHETRIGDFVTIAPLTAVSGNVTIGDGVEVGTGSSIREKCSIGEGALVGMGGVVVKDVKPHSVVVGNPAKPLKKRG